MGAGEVATRIQTDCHLVQTAVSEKIAITIQHVSTFIAGFVVAFARQPRLAGVLTTILPVIMVAGGCSESLRSSLRSHSSGIL